MMLFSFCTLRSSGRKAFLIVTLHLCEVVVLPGSIGLDAFDCGRYRCHVRTLGLGKVASLCAFRGLARAV